MTAYPPSMVIVQHLSNAGITSKPSDETDWPCYVGHLPDDNDNNAAAITDTEAIRDGRLMTGVVVEHPGIQIRVRSSSYKTAYDKIQEISNNLDALKNVIVVMSDFGAQNVTIHNASRATSPVNLGEFSPKRRTHFVVNFALTLTFG